MEAFHKLKREKSFFCSVPEYVRTGHGAPQPAALAGRLPGQLIGTVVAPPAHHKLVFDG
jgi:hypothetical protein